MATFTEIVTNVCNDLNLTDPTAVTRIGVYVNRRYKRITSALGLISTRRSTVQANVTLGSRDLTFTATQRIISVLDQTVSSAPPVVLDEISYEEMVETTPRTDAPTQYAIKTCGAHTVTIYMDFNPQVAYTLYAEVEAQTSTLSGSQEPAFDEDFHDLLEYGAKADQLRKVEKVVLARDAEADYERRLGEFRLHLAVSSRRDLVQGKRLSSGGSAVGGSGGGSVPNGAASYTQTGLITFDRDPLAPFAVTAGSAKVDNLDADFLDGLSSAAFALAANGVPASPSDATKFLNGAATPAFAQVKDSDLSTSDVATNNVTTSKHGFAPKGTADTAKFLKGDGSYDVAFALVCEARLTLTSGTPVTTADVTGATTVYLTPYRGNRIAVFDGTYWVLKALTEISLALGTLTGSLPYDVFVYSNAGTLTLEFLAWTNTTTRATALVLQDGALVKSGATTRRYLGTFYTTSATTTTDSLLKRHLWNHHYRMARPMRVLDATASWTYDTANFRQARATTTNQIEFVIGVSEDRVHAFLQALVSHSAGGNVVASIGLDSTTAVAAGMLSPFQTVAAGLIVTLQATYEDFPGIGWHRLVWLEVGGGATTTFYGVTSQSAQSGLVGTIQS